MKDKNIIAVTRLVKEIEKLRIKEEEDDNCSSTYNQCLDLCLDKIEEIGEKCIFPRNLSTRTAKVLASHLQKLGEFGEGHPNQFLTSISIYHLKLIYPVLNQIAGLGSIGIKEIDQALEE